jgi:tRNA U34 5-methylaminomethyl-2-thiouridine-forming methyltransferase MnmC
VDPGLPRFELVTTASGATSILDRVAGEIMHNPVGPWEEANALYIGPSGLSRLLAADRVSDVADDIVVFDVGLGAAANATAAIRAATGLVRRPRPQRRVHIVSFENDLCLPRFAVERAGAIPYLGALGAALATLLAQGAWESSCGRVKWELRHGDFREAVLQPLPVPDLVFFDPYSPAVNPEMWGLGTFQRLYAACTREAGRDKNTRLFTYTVATPVRTAMLKAGFFVGRGPSTGLKRETTQAATAVRALASPLDERWLIRWLRSHAKLPYDMTGDALGRVTHDVLCHPQFADMVSRALVRPGLGAHRYPPLRAME